MSDIKLNISKMDPQTEEVTDTIVCQDLLLGKGRVVNKILYLPSASKKINLIKMMIKKMGYSLNKSLGSERKWTFYIVETESLINKHIKDLRNHLPWNIGIFLSSINVFLYSQEQWKQILNKCHIVVMSASMYLSNLQTSVININDANLIIFDECHNALSSHPLNQIMKMFHDNDFKQSKSPFILGITSTLINTNVNDVKEHLNELQNTFNATIQTSYKGKMSIFSAYQKEFIRFYDKFIPDANLSCIINCITKHNNEFKLFWKLQMEQATQENINLESYFLDIRNEIFDGGAYTAFILSWIYTMEIEKHKVMFSNNTNILFLLHLVLSEINLIRKSLFTSMQENSTKNKWNGVCNNISPKLKKLLEILLNMNHTDICLVLVNHQTTAQILYHYITDYNKENGNTNIICNYTSGARDLYNLSHNEVIFKNMHDNDILKNFNERRINVLITSDLLEHEINIHCNYVIRYDTPNNFQTYMLSKYIARSNGSELMILTLDQSDFDQKLTEYIKMEQEIDEILVFNKIKDDNHEENINEFFMTTKLKLTHKNAIDIIERYCNSLSETHLTEITPMWHKKCKNNLIKYELTLPCNNIIKCPIEGSFYRDQNNAKNSSAFNACIMLYRAGDIDDYFSLVEKYYFTSQYWFPCMSEDECQLSVYGYNLNKSTKQKVAIAKPSYLNGAYPQVGNTSYLHIIHCISKNSKLMDSSYEPIDKLLKSNKEFGILTSNKLPLVANFPLFTQFGEICVHIKVNVKIIDLNDIDLKRLDVFHSKVFLDVLGIRDFIARDYRNEENSYLIVPIYCTDDTYNVDWSVVDIDTFVETNAPTMKQRESNSFKEYINTSVIVSPWYRSVSPIEKYLVTEVVSDVTPESIFPTPELVTYESYYAEKYNITIVNKNQPLINVKPLNVSTINYLVPKSVSKRQKKKFKEMLIPELCIWHKFPSVYWLKALMLPTVLYRLESLLTTLDLSMTIESKCNINVPFVPYEPICNFDVVKMDQFCSFNEPKTKEIILPICKTLKYIENSYEDLIYKCSSNNWCIDTDRQKTATILDVMNYHKFINNLHDYDCNINNRTIEIDTNDILKHVIGGISVLNLTDSEVPVLHPISKQFSDLNVGPTQSDMLKVMTPPITNDIFNYTKMQIYGNSFFEFAASLVLFDAFKLQSVTFLTKKKMKLIDHQNLFFVGMKINIGSYLLVNDYQPQDWIPPCFGIPQQLVALIEKYDLQPNVLHEVKLTKDVKYSGIIGSEDWINIETDLLKKKNVIDNATNFEIDDVKNSGFKSVEQSQSYLFINKQLIEKKIIAHCIESLVGTYVKCSGVEVGFKLLCGLGIIPNKFIDSYKPKQKMSIDQFNNLNFSTILPGYEILEDRINYSFKHKDLLLEALTHTSYQYKYPINKYFDSYERLGFIGEAILDFLIMTYITENCKEKSPEEITDIRSSLVNNTTYAALSIRIGLHRFFLYASEKLSKEIDKFYDYQNRNDHKIGQRIVYLVEERDCYELEYMDVPCALADMFKSFIAAIYLDSNRDLNFAWSMIWKLFGYEIDQFCIKVPKNPIRILQETKLNPTFRRSPDSVNEVCKGTGIMMQLNININNKIIIVHGFGLNKYKAKIAAAKIALKELKNSLNN